MIHANVKFLLLLPTLLMTIGCGSAEAMAKKARPPNSTPPPIQVSTTDRYRQGFEMGLNNAARMVHQISRSTIGAHGCDGEPAYERALLAVVKAIRPPKPGSDEDLDLARGYFKGYSVTFGRAFRDGRQECELPTVVTGELPGTVVGSLLCGAGSNDVKLLDLVEVEPIYTGWSGGNAKSKSECGNIAMKTAEGCAIAGEEDREKVEKILNDQIALGCAD